jgi:site-specific recombinase XerD
LTLEPDAGQLVVRAGQQPRVIALNASARAALVRYLAEQWGVEDTLSVVQAAWERQHPNTLLWTSQKGETLRARSLSRVLEELLAECIERGLVPAGTSPRALRGKLRRSSLIVSRVA